MIGESPWNRKDRALHPRIALIVHQQRGEAVERVGVGLVYVGEVDERSLCGLSLFDPEAVVEFAISIDLALELRPKTLRV